MSVLRLFVGVLVTLIWSAAWAVAILRSDYSGIGAITPVMLLVVGGMFGQDALRLLRQDDSKKGQKKE